MAEAPTVLLALRRVVEDQRAKKLSDPDLLQRFATGREEAAFRALLRRHGPMVLSVCRAMLPNEADAEDAFQATFLVLAHKATSIRRAAALGSWLHGVAHRTARRAQAEFARRQRHECRAARHEAYLPDDLTWREVQQVLHEELGGLSARYRAPLTLCYLQGKTLDDAAVQLGLAKSTLKARLERGRAVLRARLVRRGLGPAAALLASAWPALATAGLPAGLLGATARAALGVATGKLATGLVSAQVAALIEGVLNAMSMTRLKTLTAVLTVLSLIGLGVGGLAFTAAAPKPGRQVGQDRPAAVSVAPAVKTDAERLAGTWLYDVASLNTQNELARFWTSKLTVTGDSFALTKFMDLSQDLKGKFVLDPTATPKTIDLKVDEFDLEAAGAPAGWGKIPACTLPGIYKFDGDRLTVCFTIEGNSPRPTTFEDTGDKIARVSLAKAGAGFAAFPDEVTVKVIGTNGRPAAGVTVAGFMSLRENPQQKDAKPEWNYYETVKTGADGTAKVKYEKLRFYPVLARDPETKGMAAVPVSPVSLLSGEVCATLEPECRVVGTITCDQLAQAGRPIGWTNVYLMQDGRRVADCSSQEGKFEFPVPPGTYTLDAYGGELKRRHVTITVPADRSEFVVDPIALTASKLVPLLGKPAPELAGVVGWKGEKVALADLKGKYVLLEFWGYWCGPCVQAMPVLIELHEKFADKGLAVIGVHVDGEGEVDTAAKLDERIAGIKAKLWNGKDLPFPVALMSGKRVGEGDAKARGLAADQYGILSYPTTILIDRDGKIVGKFHARDAKNATAEVEKLLNAKK